MSLFLFIVILVILILVHEFGHFIVAKLFGIRVDEFSIGFGPTWFRKRYGETEYTFKPLLAGGYVKIFGENPDEESMFGPESARSFYNKPKWMQAAVLVAGVGFNILLAWVIFSLIFMIGMPTAVSEEERHTVRDPKLIIVDVLPDSPAGATGLEGGDELLTLAAGGESVENLTADTVTLFISSHGQEEITVSYKRGEELLTTTVMPTGNIIPDEPQRAAIGISMGTVGVLKLPLHRALWEGGAFTIEMLGLVMTALASFFVGVFTFSADFSQIAGPVGIVGLVGDAAALGVVSLLLFTAIISLNLAVINILPFPALDGGRLLFVLIEKLKGSPIRPVVANTLNTIGFALLILLIILVTYNDIVRLFIQ